VTYPEKLSFGGRRLYRCYLKTIPELFIGNEACLNLINEKYTKVVLQKLSYI